MSSFMNNNSSTEAVAEVKMQKSIVSQVSPVFCVQSSVCMTHYIESVSKPALVFLIYFSMLP